MIEKLTKDLISKMVIEIKKEDNKKQIQENILNPILCQFTDRIYPYITLLFTMYSVNLILIIFILILIITNNKKNI